MKKKELIRKIRIEHGTLKIYSETLFEIYFKVMKEILECSERIIWDGYGVLEKDERKKELFFIETNDYNDYNAYPFENILIHVWAKYKFFFYRIKDVVDDDDKKEKKCEKTINEEYEEFVDDEIIRWCQIFVKSIIEITKYEDISLYKIGKFYRNKKDELRFKPFKSFNLKIKK